MEDDAFKDTVSIAQKHLTDSSSRAGIGSITSRDEDPKAVETLKKFFKPRAEQSAEPGTVERG